MELISIGSSSSGNSYIIKAGCKNLLLDVGLSGAKILKALGECQIEPENVDAVLITHEHIDHVRSVRTIAKKCPNAKFLVSKGTLRNCNNFDKIEEERIHLMASQDEAGNDDVLVRCFGLSHDAEEPIGYSVIADGQQLTVVTDTGVITDEIYNEMLSADILVFEANHEERLLMVSDYPYSVKMRIKSDYGHLSNSASAEVLLKLMNDRNNDERDIANRNSKIKILLAHLSERNNLPSEASGRIKDILAENGYIIDEDYSLDVALKEGLTRI